MNTGFVTVPKNLSLKHFTRLMTVPSIKDVEFNGNLREMTTTDMP